MARRPSTVSVTTLASSRTPLDSLRSPDPTSALSPLSSKLSLRVLSQPGGLGSTRTQDDAIDFDPDELFAKYTIAEVKARQAQLRADAEAKQEDLRIMVGERYRDLLQASSSIMSIAASAMRVQEALEDSVTAIRSQRVPAMHNHISQSRKDDSHLQILQVLSAHIKLLLDAPEHLWRLIEREKYFQAAWLFLLARVVHRALIRDDVQDDASWTRHGIDALEQFPLIQRQWETVSHFRTQIIHRATLSLRSYDKTSEETCATLLTLHILDSRPLAETLAIYLSQRTRTLNALLAKTLDGSEQHYNGFPVNGDLPEARKSSKGGTILPAKTVALAVKNATRTTLEAISRTLCTARAIFGTSSPALSLAENALDNIQSEPSNTSASLPAELLLNTQAVLNSLPSSTYVSLLPADIRSYRPFVDLTSVSSSLPQEALRDKLGSWFVQSIANLREAFDKWLASLDVVSAIWKIRLSLRRWVVHSNLLTPEISHLTEMLDEAFRTRISAVWKAVLVSSEAQFMRVLGSTESEDVEDMFSPLHSLYRSPSALQSTPATGPSFLDSSFHTYKTTLTQQLGGRAPQLHEALRTLEDPAAALQQDLVRMFADGETSQRLVNDLTAAYSPEAQALCQRITSAIKESSEKLMASPDVKAAMSRLVFHAHIAKELSTSPFACNIVYDQGVETRFREEMKALFQRIMACWEEHVVSQLVSYYARNANANDGCTCSQPSPPMMECLYLLSSSIHNLGMNHHPAYLMTTPQRLISQFSAAFVRTVGEGDFDLRVLYDLSLLRHLSSKWKDADVTVLEHTIDRLRSHLISESPEPDLNLCASECLSRTQMLISALLPPISGACEGTCKEMGGMLTFGVPVVDTQFVPAVEAAPPSSRFPLLLIDVR